MNEDGIDPDMLRQKYLIEGQSDRQIAEALGVPEHRVRLARRAYGIPSRPRGYNLTGAQRPAIDYGFFRDKTHTAGVRARISAAAQRQVNRPSGQFHPYFGAFGARNPNYRHGDSPERQRLYSTYAWRCLIEWVYIRDGGQCQKCGIHIEAEEKQRHHHHIFGFEEYPDLRLDPDNVVLMCRGCHEWLHSAANVKRIWLAPIVHND